MTVFAELSIIIVIATAMAALMRLLKQPLIMGYILTGLIAGPLVFDIVQSTETFEVFAQMGVAILLFIVGIGLSPMIIREVGKVAVITGLGQIFFTTFFGFLLSQLFGYDAVTSFFIAIALTFSSTIIILKLLSDKGDTKKLYGRISIGFLLVQDIVAVLILVGVSSFAQSNDLVGDVAITLLKLGALVSGLGLFSVYVLPKLSHFFANSQEYLFLFAIGWGLGCAAIFSYFGFSIEIGALFAGIALAVSPYSKEIESKLKPLRDFFIIMFFILLGTHVTLNNITPVLMQAVVFSIFVLVGNPLIVVILMSILKYNKKTSFMSGLTVAQISEFSLILILIGRESGVVSEEVVSLVTLVGLFTIAGSTYMIKYSDKLYQKLSRYLSMVERKEHINDTLFLGAYEIILFGCDRVGYDFLEQFRDHDNFLIVDYDPQLVRTLKEQGLDVMYGDIEDGEFLEDINVGDAEMVFSTVPDHEANLYLVSKVRSMSEETIIIAISFSIHEALELYDKGATYILLPHFIGGHFISRMASNHGPDVEKFEMEKSRHIKYLKKRQQLGHSYPIKTSH